MREIFALPLARKLAPRAARFVRVVGALTLVAYVGYVAYLGLGLGAGSLDGFFNTWLYIGLVAASAVLCVARAVTVRAERGAWLVLGVAIAMASLGETYWSFVLAGLGGAAPFPSPADLLWLLFYPPAYVALGLLIRRRLRSLPHSVWLDGAIGVLGVAALGAAVVFPPVLASTGGSVAAVATNLAYPLADVLLLMLVMAMFALFGWRPDRIWCLIGAALATLAIADSVYLLQTAAGSYEEGSLLDVLWPTGYGLIAYAAWQPVGDAVPARPRGWAVLIVPSLFALAALGVLLAGHFVAVNLVATLLATATIIAAGVRTAVTFGEARSLADSRHQALTDELTGLPNRRHFYARLGAAIEAARLTGATAVVLLVDLDRFKELNDALGHHAGDRLLEQIGPRLEATLPNAEILGRLGGVKFAILLSRESRPQEAIAAAREVLVALQRPFAVSDLSIQTGASIGIAIFPEHAGDAETLLQRADVAMYHARANRGGVEVYAPERDEHSRDRIVLAGELREAIKRDELVVHYQPKAELQTGTVIGVEALVRWAHARRGLLYPDTFLPLAEHSDLMRPLTLAVLHQALRQCAQWERAGLRPTVAVNISVSNLLDTRFPEEVKALLRSHNVGAERLQLEITENVVMADPERSLDILARLSENGVGLSLDDFGTGYSSLSYLKRLPVKELKIDRSFVTDMATDRNDAAIVRATVELGRSLGLVVVAEGVESADVWRQLRTYGCDIAQGYYLAKPMPAQEIGAWLARHAQQVSGERTGIAEGATRPPLGMSEGISAEH
jgi:diguanylate cyclase (GGDEF)-like protein